MRKLSTEKRAMILTALVEGNSINATARMFGASKVTILRLLADAGTLAADFHDFQVRELESKRVQVDELWSFVGCKQRSAERGKQGVGDVWTWTAIDADSKLCVSYRLGDRDAMTAHQFIEDVADRIDTRIQLSSDGLQFYGTAVERVWGGEVDYGRIIKQYHAERPDNARYSPATCTAIRKEVIVGDPDQADISTSYVERQNLTVRMGIRRFTRLTNAFSKKIENHAHAVALHYFHYNFVRKHQTIKTTPAVAAGVANHRWTMLEFVEMLEAEERKLGGRLTNYLKSK